METQTDEKIQGHRIWQLYRYAIEAYVKAADDNKNLVLIHCCRQTLLIRERALDEVEGR